MSRDYLLRKVAQAALTIVAVAILNFLLFRLIPGDPVRSLLPRNVSAAQKQALRERLGLDQPLLPGVYQTPQGLRLKVDKIPETLVENQFVTYLGNLATLELGGSFFERKPVVEVIAERFWPTVILVLSAEALALLFGILIGIRAGWKRGGWFDTLTINPALVLYAVPLFWLAMLLLFFLATPNGIPVFPSQQMTTPGRQFSGPLEAIPDVLAHLALPSISLALGLFAGYALIMRSSIIDVLAEDYITTARAKGLKENDVLRRHAIPNALLPTVTLVALTLGYVLGGAIGVEQVFSWPGMGTLIIRSVTQKDFPVLQGVFLLITVSVVLANLLANLLYGLLDPRVRR